MAGGIYIVVGFVAILFMAMSLPGITSKTK